MQSTNNGSKMSGLGYRKPLNNILQPTGCKTRLPISNGNSTSWPATNPTRGVCREVRSFSTREYYPTARMMRESLSSWGMRSPMPWLTTATERMSQQALIQYGQAAATEILGHDQSDARKAILAAAIGMGTNVGITLPFSRKHEYEADHLGLIFMAMAGYDPNEAIAFWTRMANASTGKQPEFLSTHPADEKRIAKLKSVIPEALKYKKN